jgi:4-hydroxyphenylpyruvate dioxygenase
MKVASMVDVIHPDGLVRGRVVEALGGALRITLNGADTHRKLAGRFLAETFGASVAHIALATDDIFTTLERLSNLGFELTCRLSNCRAETKQTGQGNSSRLIGAMHPKRELHSILPT